MGWRNGGIFGSNTGNMLYQWAAYRSVSAPGVETVADAAAIERGALRPSDIGYINATFDHYLLPLANAFRPSYVRHLERLVSTIIRLQIPTTVLGVGLQLKPHETFADMPPDINEAAARFVAAVLQNSPSVGVRGEVTGDYLKFLGFSDDEVDVIGCPSMFLHGADLHIDKPATPPDAESLIALNVTPSAKRMAGLIAHVTHAYPQSIYVAQEYRDIAMMLWGMERHKPKDGRIPTHYGHTMVRTNRMRAFIDGPPWLEFLRDADFVLGSRIHGNIAGILAGRPAVVIAHDHRTKELAQYHAIPYRMIGDITGKTTVAELWDEADYSALNRRHPQLLAHYRDFLVAHGLPHVFDEEGAPGAAAFDAAMAATNFPRGLELDIERMEIAQGKRTPLPGQRLAAPADTAPSGRSWGAEIDTFPPSLGDRPMARPSLLRRIIRKVRAGA